MARIRITSRSEGAYLLSKILRKRSSDLWKVIQTKDLNGLNDIEKECLKRFEDLVTVKASEESLSEFETYKNNVTFLNLNEITDLAKEQLLRADFTFEKILPWINNEETARHIVKFYNFLTNFLDPKDLVVFFFKFSLTSSISAAAEVYSGNNHQCVTFTPGWANSTLQKNLYKFGTFSVSHFFGTFVHEFCHGLLCYLKVTSDNSETKRSFNRFFSNDTSERYQTCKELIQYCKRLPYNDYVTESITDTFINYITREAINSEINALLPKKGFDTINVVRLLLMTAVPSKYGREKYDKQIEELVCEAFAYWYFAPEDERNYYWQLIHEYFSKVIWKWYVKTNDDN